MAEIVKFIRDNDIKIIFTDGMSNPKVANTIARGGGTNFRFEPAGSTYR